MELALPPEVEAEIERRLRSGAFDSPEAVVTAAVISFRNDEAADGFGPGEVNALLEKCEQSEMLDGITALDDFRKWRAEASRR